MKLSARKGVGTFRSSLKISLHKMLSSVQLSASKRMAVLVSILTIACILSVYAQSSLRVGYTILTADDGSTLPIASALFTYANSSGVLVSQAGIAAAEPISAGRVFVEDGTAIALVNPSTRAAFITFSLRDAVGNEIFRTNQSLAAGNHLARFVSQMFSPLPPGFSGSLTFDSSERLAAITIRQSENVYREHLYATLPVADLRAPSGGGTLVFPHIAVGGGYKTQLIL